MTLEEKRREFESLRQEAKELKDPKKLFGILNDHFPTELTEADIDFFLKEAREEAGHTHFSQLAYSLDEVLAKDFKPDNFIIEPILPQIGISLLVGQPKMGKTTIAREIASHILWGREHFAGMPITNRTGVVIIDFENTGADMKKYIQLKTELWGPCPNDYPLYFYPSAENKSQKPIPENNEAKLDLLRSAMSDCPEAGLFVIDLMGKFFRVKDGNAYSENINVFEPFERLLKEEGRAMLLLHHSPKGKEDEALGSTAILGNAVSSLYVRGYSETERVLGQATPTRGNGRTKIDDLIWRYDNMTANFSLSGEVPAVQEERLAGMNWKYVLEAIEQDIEAGNDTGKYEQTKIAKAARKLGAKFLMNEKREIFEEFEREGKIKLFSGGYHNTEKMLSVVSIINNILEPKEENPLDEEEM